MTGAGWEDRQENMPSSSPITRALLPLCRFPHHLSDQTALNTTVAYVRKQQAKQPSTLFFIFYLTETMRPETHCMHILSLLAWLPSRIA